MSGAGRTRALAGAALVAVFAAGAATGFVARGQVGGAAAGDVIRDVPLRPGELPPPLDDLGLSAGQRTRVAAILEHRRARTAAIMHEPTPRLRANLDSLQMEVRAVLTPAQRRRFDHIVPFPASPTPVTMPLEGPPPGSPGPRP